MWCPMHYVADLVTLAYIQQVSLTYGVLAIFWILQHCMVYIHVQHVPYIQYVSTGLN